MLFRYVYTLTVRNNTQVVVSEKFQLSSGYGLAVIYMYVSDYASRVVGARVNSCPRVLQKLNPTPTDDVEMP